MTNVASEPTTHQPISRPAGTSHTISPERRREKIPSACGAKPQAGTTNISLASSPHEILHPIPLLLCVPKRRQRRPTVNSSPGQKIRETMLGRERHHLLGV